MSVRPRRRDSPREIRPTAKPCEYSSAHSVKKQLCVRKAEDRGWRGVVLRDAANIAARLCRVVNMSHKITVVNV